MELKYNIQESVAVITLSSNILGTPADSKLFEAKIKAFLEKGIERVILDLSDVRRINSTGLAILITGFNLLSNSGGSFALTNLNDLTMDELIALYWKNEAEIEELRKNREANQKSYIVGEQPKNADL